MKKFNYLSPEVSFLEFNKDDVLKVSGAEPLAGENLFFDDFEEVWQ